MKTKTNDTQLLAEAYGKIYTKEQFNDNDIGSAVESEFGEYRKMEKQLDDMVMQEILPSIKQSFGEVNQNTMDKILDTLCDLLQMHRSDEEDPEIDEEY